MASLRVQDVCPTSRVLRADGRVLREAIEKLWNDSELLELDFGGLTIASISFLDEGVASLFVDYDAEVIRRRLKIVGIAEDDRKQLNSLVARRRAQRTAA